MNEGSDTLCLLLDKILLYENDIKELKNSNNYIENLKIENNVLNNELSKYGKMINELNETVDSYKNKCNDLIAKNEAYKWCIMNINKQKR